MADELESGIDSTTDGASEHDHLAGLAAELTGSVGLSDDATYGDEVPADLASDVEEYNTHHDGKAQREVPLSALHEERRARQQLQQQIAEREAQVAAAEQRAAAVLQQLQAQQLQAQQQAAEAAIPNFNDDPEGHVNALRQQFTAELQRMQQSQQQAQYQQAHAAQLEAEIQQVHARIADHEAEFAQQHGDYQQAAEAVHHAALQQMRAMHPTATVQQLGQAQRVAVAQFVGHCLQNGVDPCAQIHERGRQLLGLTREGQQAKHQARQAPAQAPGIQQFTVENLASMSDAEFDAAWQAMAKSNAPKFGFGG